MPRRRASARIRRRSATTVRSTPARRIAPMAPALRSTASSSRPSVGVLPGKATNPTRARLCHRAPPSVLSTVAGVPKPESAQSPGFIFKRASVLLLGALEPDGQCDLVADGRDACFHAEVGALELAHHNAAAAFLRRRRGRVALEARDRPRDGLGYTETRRGAFARHGVVAGKDDTCGLEGHPRKFGAVEKIGGAQVLVAR